MERSVQKHAFYKYFKGLCIKRMCRYRARESQTSKYIELDVGNKTYLFRFSDHPVSPNHPWTPDFDISDKQSFKRAKNFLKMYHGPVDISL